MLAASAVAEARDEAPMPAAFVDETRRGEFEIYDPIPPIRGTYAHGVAEGPVIDETDPPASLCQGSDEERRSLIETYRSVSATEYWFYGTKEQGVLFIKTVRLLRVPETDPLPCSRAVWTSFEIERAYVADGFVHNFVFDENTVPGLGSHRKDRTAGEYAGSTMRLQTLMARPPLPERGLRRDTVAGVPAVCTGQSGLVWNSTCYAAEGDLRGMLLRSAAGDDERVMFSYRVLEVRSGVLLPGAVFEVDRDWNLREKT
jgi:hypothetical protein